MKQVLIIIPVYNEAQNIEKVISEIRKDIDFADVLVINDGSTDSTLQIIKSLGVNYLDLPFNLGYSGALQAGFKYAANKGYEYVIQYDGDGQHIALEAKKLYQTIISDKIDIVIGSRFGRDSDYEHHFLRKLGTNIFRILIKLICKKNIQDPTSGFQIINRNVFQKYARMYNYPEFPDANLIIEMLLCGYRIEEIPVKMRQRFYGKSMHHGILKPIQYMIKTVYDILLVIIKYIKIGNYQSNLQNKESAL